jgi:hypothetical protein
MPSKIRKAGGAKQRKYPSVSSPKMFQKKEQQKREAPKQMGRKAQMEGRVTSSMLRANEFADLMHAYDSGYMSKQDVDDLMLDEGLSQGKAMDEGTNLETAARGARRRAIDRHLGKHPALVDDPGKKRRGFAKDSGLPRPVEAGPSGRPGDPKMPAHKYVSRRRK